MGIAEYMRADCILLDMKSTSKQEVFDTLTSGLLTAGLLDDAGVKLLVKKLEERESLSTTGVGEGIAIPHASLEGFSKTVIPMGLVPDGVDFASVDGKEAKVVFMIVGSLSDPRLHIQILARIVRLCRKPGLLKELMEAKTPQEVIDIIRKWDS